MTMAVNYLKKAPVDIIVVSATTTMSACSMQEMCLQGEQEDANVTVDNSYSSRKYYEYGQNMLMFSLIKEACGHATHNGN